jgi:hypothetical protein
MIIIRSYLNGRRSVSFEKPEISVPSYGDRIGETARFRHVTGNGPSVAEAFLQALHLFHKGMPLPLLSMRRVRRNHAATALSAKLDMWLGQTRGRLEAVKDFDGAVICRLEGTIRHQDGTRSHVTLETSGYSFTAAVNNVMSLALPELPAGSRTTHLS